MPEPLDWKLIAAIVAATLNIVGFIPYFYGIFAKKTKPHIYTWLIWTITLGIAAAGMWRGEGGLLLSISMTLSTLMASAVLLLCLRYGTKNIHKTDAIALGIALIAVYVWVGLDEPVLAILIATGIDLVGYWPTYRKSFAEPWSENLLSWIIYTLGPAMSLLALMEYNLLTITYSAATMVANIILVALLVLRRPLVRKPKPA